MTGVQTCARPISAVFESDTEAGRLVAIAPETLGGAPVSIIVEPQSTAGGEKLYASLLVNAYDRPGQTPFMRWIRDGLLRYVDKKKFPAVFALSVGRRLPDTALQNRPGTPKILTEKNLDGWRRANPDAGAGSEASAQAAWDFGGRSVQQLAISFFKWRLWAFYSIISACPRRFQCLGSSEP